ncbi:hypothetical protein ACFL3U_07160, partial [Pseudomonadota bacterium]
MDPQSVVSRVVERVLGDGSVPEVSYKTILTPTSVVFRIDYLAGEKNGTLYAKLIAENESSIEIQRHRKEFDTTRRVRAALPTDRELDVVTPAAYLDEIDALVTWGVAGHSLQDIIANSQRFRYMMRNAEPERLSRLAGQWLRRFHGADLLAGDFDVGKIIYDYCAERLDLLARTKDSRVSTDLANLLKRKIADWTEESMV